MKIGRLPKTVILPLNRESVTAGELAEHFGVPVRTVKRDVPSIALAEKFSALAGRCDAPHICWNLGVMRENRKMQKVHVLPEEATERECPVRFHYRSAHDECAAHG